MTLSTLDIDRNSELKVTGIGTVMISNDMQQRQKLSTICTVTTKMKVEKITLTTIRTDLGKWGDR